jgi:signal transduction histidine kinase
MRICYVRRVLTAELRDRLAITVSGVALVVGLLSILIGSYDSGISFMVDNGRLVVADVEPLSQAARDGVQPGMVAVSLNGLQLIDLPTTQYGEPDPANPDAQPPVIGIVPSVPTPTGFTPGDLLGLTRQPLEWVTLITMSGLQTGGADNWPIVQFAYPAGAAFTGSRLAILPGLVLLFGCAWWLRAGRAGGALKDIAIPLAAAVAVPFVVLPYAAIGAFLPLVLAGLITTVAMIPLALALVERIDAPDDRGLILVGVGVFAAASAVMVVSSALGSGEGDGRGTLRWALIGMIPLLPGVVAAGPIDLKRLRAASGRGPAGLLQSTELAVAGATPILAVGTDRWPYLWPLFVWLAALAVAARFTVRPLARLATRATLQRDLIVAATEAERARLAADIHDDALQELTLLVRRLEASGDTEGAEIGRTVADRLRAICGDLRLPILDDLGVGPALDWLVLRIERLAGGEVRLERADEARHSPDVELAFFRVAQEALANAVKHGRPPIVVRYRSTANGISLAIDDAGPGIPDDAPDAAEKAGRFGLLNMAQRADQIGAILDVKRWPGGGTHVALEWRPR